MSQYRREDLIEALQVVDSTIKNCEKMQPKICRRYITTYTS